MIQATGTNSPTTITLDDIERIRDLILSNPPPQTEMKMHPTDMEYLRSRYGTFQIAPNTLSTIRIIEDAETPLLPRCRVASENLSL